MKQDISGVRTAQDLERKYDLNSIGSLKKNYELQKDSLNKVENELRNFVEVTTQNLEELQDQVDGNITTWFYSGVPTLNNNPANLWTTTEEKNNHLGDLYYDSDTGYAYRFALENNVYSWKKITDTDVTSALALANAAKDAADSKRRVFVVTPTTPYDVGDLWIKDEEIYRCQIEKDESESYAERDWIKATKYTDDTLATEVNGTLQVLSGRVVDIDSSTYKKIEIQQIVDGTGVDGVNVSAVITTNGYTFDKSGLNIYTSENDFNTQITNEGTYYKDGNSVIGQYTKDGSKQKDLDLFGTYRYGKNGINDNPMFIAQLYTDENGEECFGHFYNGGDY